MKHLVISFMVSLLLIAESGARPKAYEAIVAAQVPSYLRAEA